MDLAIRSSAIVPWEWDITGRRVDCGLIWTQVLGHGPEGTRTLEEDFVDVVHPDDRESIRAAIGPHLRGTTPFGECEFRVRHRDGRWVWIRCLGRVVERDSAGKAVRAAGTLVDTTAQDRVRDLILQAYAEHEERAGLAASGTE